MNTDVILTSATAEAWDGLNLCYVGRINLNLPEMSWLSYVLPLLPDDERVFPHGKWASIQELNRQLIECAKTVATQILQDQEAKQS